MPPSLDFTEVLVADEFQDVITVTSTSRVIGNDGEETDTPAAAVSTFAVVIPGKSSTIRQADGSRVEAYIEVYTQYRLTAGFKTSDTNQRSGDVITWHGRTYTVMVTEDYSAFGTGFIKASCDLDILAPPN